MCDIRSNIDTLSKSFSKHPNPKIAVNHIGIVYVLASQDVKTSLLSEMSGVALRLYYFKDSLQKEVCAKNSRNNFVDGGFVNGLHFANETETQHLLLTSAKAGCQFLIEPFFCFFWKILAL